MTIFYEVSIRHEIRDLSDEALEQEFIQGDRLRVAGIPSSLRQAFNQWGREIEAEMTRRKPVVASVSDDWQMFTDRANRDVANAVHGVAKALAAGEIITEAGFLNALSVAIKAVAKKHGEVYDTEPRNQIRDWADMVGDKMGWNEGRYNYGDKTGDRLSL